MTDWPRFPNAPILEAILDIRVAFREQVDVSRLASFHDAVRDRYPIREERVTWEGEVQVAHAGVQQTVKRGAEGFMFRSADGRRVVQARQDGFTFNWLKPYQDWPALRGEAKGHWETYVSMFRPSEVTRLALRYINRVELPLPLEDFHEYVLTGPQLAPDLPQALKTFFLRLEVPNETIGAIAIVSETIQAPTEGGRLPFIFDVDAIKEARFEPSSQTIWQAFEHLREFKNLLFFKSMTPKAQELFR